MPDKRNIDNSNLDQNCRRCKKLAQDGIKCIKCGKISHKSCIKILQNSKQQCINFVDNDKLICCFEEISEEKDGQPQTSLVFGALEQPNQSFNPSPSINVKQDDSTDHDKAKIYYLEELIRHKDLIIYNQDLAIKSLTDQVALLKHISSVNDSSSDLDYKVVRQSSSSNQAVNNSQAPSCSIPVVPKSSVAAAIHTALAKTTCEKVINLTKDITDEGNRITPTPNKPSRPIKTSSQSRTILVGNMSSTNTCALKAASSTPMKHFHVTNLDPTVEENDLVIYLKQFVSDVIVLKLRARNPQKYSSFKISVPTAKAQCIMNSEIWPEGVMLNWFFPSRIQQRPSAK